MRTTLTLDPDVANSLRNYVRQTGHSFKSAVNDAIRRGLNEIESVSPPKRFKVRPLRIGKPRPGVDLNNINALLEQVEGPYHS